MLHVGSGEGGAHENGIGGGFRTGPHFGDGRHGVVISGYAVGEGFCEGSCFQAFGHDYGAGIARYVISQRSGVHASAVFTLARGLPCKGGLVAVEREVEVGDVPRGVVAAPLLPDGLGTVAGGVRGDEHQRVVALRDGGREGDCRAGGALLGVLQLAVHVELGGHVAGKGGAIETFRG